MNAAMGARDGTAIAALLAPDFQSIDVSGRVETAAQMIDVVKALEPDPHKESTTTVSAVDATSDTATVEQRYDMKSVRPGKDGIDHHIEFVANSTDVWVKIEHVWLLKQTVTKDISFFSDGQLVSHEVKP